MDYLNKLPVELWEEIVSQLVDLYNLTALPDFIALSLYPECMGISKVQRNQQTLSRLLPISKALYALIEPLLYQEIFIQKEPAYRRFLDSAKTPFRSPSGHRRGIWTKEVYILDEKYDHSDLEVHVDEVLGACPNISQLLILNRDRMREIGWSTEAWSSNIRSIALGMPGIGHKHLLYIANHCPGLTTLKLSRITRHRVWTSYTITFSSLVRLSLSQSFAQDLFLDALKCPQLQTLYIQLSNWCCVENFLKRHAETLTHLKVYPPADPWENLVLPSYVLHLCKGLRWISFHPDYTEPIPVQTPCKKLVHLDLTWQASLKTPKWKQHAEVFSSTMFPNLSLVTISVPSRTSNFTPNATQEEALRDMRQLFTSARVELNVNVTDF